MLLVLMILMVTPAYSFELFGYKFGATAIAAERENDEQEATKQKEAQIKLLETLGVLKTSNKLDASGTAIIMMMSRDNTGVFSYQYLTDSETNKIEEVMTQKGLIKNQINKETGKVERHIMVFNPKDKHTYVWIPLSKARETAERIKTTGHTLERKQAPKRLNTEDLRTMDFNLSF